MSQQDNFVGGFLLGTVVGGIIGGITGVLVSSRLAAGEAAEAESPTSEGEKKSPGQSQLTNAPDQSIELARRSLEDKIAQLNDAIDDVRQQLGGVNGISGADNGEQAIAKDL
ncbi:MAG: hypothetical protein VKK04_22655 [Synechococcales bacterium]|nr:hypothetical protein [Synechococcales bacterium]